MGLPGSGGGLRPTIDMAGLRSRWPLGREDARAYAKTRPLLRLAGGVTAVPRGYLALGVATGDHEGSGPYALPRPGLLAQDRRAPCIPAAVDTVHAVFSAAGAVQ